MLNYLGRRLNRLGENIKLLKVRLNYLGENVKLLKENVKLLREKVKPFRGSGVPRGAFRGFNPPSPRKSEILTKYQKLRNFYYMK
jgi:hypothetical protein